MTTDVTSATSTAPAPTSISSAGTTTEALASDFETFLKMLTAQARFQDPLEPLDSSEYASQLAQFSMVEQQVKTNESLGSLMSLQTTSALSVWVGMDVRAQGAAWYDGDAVTVVPQISDKADAAQLVVRDEDGTEVQRIVLPLSNEPRQWAGVDDEGIPFASGHYSFEVESFQNSQVIETAPIEVYSRVTEAQVNGTDVKLVLEGGNTLTPAQVTALREPIQVGV